MMNLASRVVQWCQTSLKRRPILTNTTVYAIFYSSAELSQQTYNKYFTPDNTDYDLASVARLAMVGSCLYAPTLYCWYKFLDRNFTGTSIRVVATKVAADQLFMTPILLTAFYSIIGVLERQDDAFEELRTKFWRTFLANQVFWCPAQTINFFYVPSHLRVVYVATASFIWINVLCSIKRQKNAII